MESDDEDDKVITLNVGGVRYTTTLGVLRSFTRSMLGAMFAKHNAQMLHAEDDGSFKIDYHCKRFDLILDFLGDHDDRRFRKRIAILSEEDRRQLRRDVEFFSLDEVVFWLEMYLAQPGPRMRRARHSCATVQHGRKLYVFGGCNNGGPLSSMEILDLDTMEFEEGKSMLSARFVCAAVQIDESRILVIGGHDGDDYLDTTEVLDIVTGEFMPGPSLLTARRGHAAVAIDEHRVLIAGGTNDDCIILLMTEVLDIRTMTLSPGPKMSSPQSISGAVKLDSNRVLVVGSEYNLASTTDILDITSADITSWSFAPGPRLKCRSVTSVVPLHDSTHFLFVGGADFASRPTNTTEVLDVNTMSFEPGPVMRTGRNFCVAAALYDHRIIVLGGDDSNYEVLSSSEVITINNDEAAEEEEW